MELFQKKREQRQTHSETKKTTQEKSKGKGPRAEEAYSETEVDARNTQLNKKNDS